MTTGFVTSDNKDALKIYLAGPCLHRGDQMQRAAEKEELSSLGHSLYNPQDNKAINDKANAVQEGLAERIVSQDTSAIGWSDTVVIEPLSHALGTTVELGQILGMRDVAEEIINYIDNCYAEDKNNLSEIRDMCMRHVNRKVYTHCSDVRRHNDSPQTGDRREFATNQYVYGACLKLTGGRGFYEWDEIIEELKK